jgi:leader peptidase (prepilin peptidase)/N-methyltransferase
MDKAKLIQIPLYFVGLVCSLVAADIRQHWIIIVMFCLLLAITIVELKTGLILNKIVFPGIALGISLNASAGMDSFIDSLLGIVVCGGIFAIICVVSSGGMGWGIPKLSAMIGAFVGWKLGLAAVWATSVIGGLCAAFLLLTKRRKRKEAIEFGPFLAFSTMLVVILGYFVADLSAPFFWFWR